MDAIVRRIGMANLTVGLRLGGEKKYRVQSAECKVKTKKGLDTEYRVKIQ